MKRTNLVIVVAAALSLSSCAFLSPPPTAAEAPSPVTPLSLSALLGDSTTLRQALAAEVERNRILQPGGAQ